MMSIELLVGEARQLRGYVLRSVGSGLLVGAADNDPAGVSTYAVVGATHGYAFLWLMPICALLLIAIQRMCARLAGTTRQGLGETIRARYGRGWALGVALTMVLIGLATLSADLVALAEGVSLLTGAPARLLVVPIVLFALTVTVALPYEKFARYVTWLAGLFACFVVAAVLAHPDWHAVLQGTFVPPIRLDGGYLVAAVGTLGTTVTPYLFFWQARAELAEPRLVDGRGPRLDVVVAMCFANAVAYFIMVAAAGLAPGQGIQTATDAARALVPAVGAASSTLFALGLVGSGLVATPILAASTSAAVAEAMGWPAGLEKRGRGAPHYFATIVLAFAVAGAIGLLPIEPIAALFYSQVLAGLLAPPLVALIVLLSGDRRVMGSRRAGQLERVLGSVAAVILTLAAALLVGTFLKGSMAA